MKNIHFYSTFRICFYFVQLSLVLPTENVVSFIKLRLHWKGCITARNYAETLCTNIRNNFLQNCSAKYLPSRKLKFEDQPLKCYNSKTRLSQTGFPIYFLIFTTSSITSPIACMMVPMSESVFFRFCSDRNLFRVLVIRYSLASSLVFWVIMSTLWSSVIGSSFGSSVIKSSSLSSVLWSSSGSSVIGTSVCFSVIGSS